MGTFKAAMYMYNIKFARLLSGSYAVNETQLCMQASISTLVNSSTFTRGSAFVFPYYSLGGQPCYAGRAIRWTLPRISSCFSCFGYLVVPGIDRSTTGTLCTSGLVDNVIFSHNWFYGVSCICLKIDSGST